MSLLFQSITLILSFAFVFVWQNSPLAEYTIPILGFFVFIFLIISARKKGFYIGNYEATDGKITIFILSTLILLLIDSTGGMFSSLFFLLYFLGFGIAFIFEPAVVFVFAALGIGLFLPELINHLNLENILRVGSLFLIAPLAFFFGREFRREDTQEKIVQSVSEKIVEDIEGIVQDGQPITNKQEEKLDDILKQTDTLRNEK